MNTIEFLTRFERNCLTLYRGLIDTAPSPELKVLYELLADTRSRHLELLESRSQKVNKDIATSECSECSTYLANGFTMPLTADSLNDVMRNDRDGFEHIIKGEEEIIRICEGLAKTETTEGAKTLLNWFVHDERRHLEEVENIYEFVEMPHNFLAWGEFSNLHPL